MDLSYSPLCRGFSIFRGSAAQVIRQQFARIGDRILVGVQVPLRGHERSVPGDLAQVVHRHAGIGHPCQPGVPQIVPSRSALRVDR